MIEWLTRPLTYEFMQRGLVASTLVGVLCAVVGCYVVLRGMAFLGDALAHAILPGVAIAYLFNSNLLLGALIAAVVVALLIGFLSRQGTIKEDTAIGILFAAALSLGVLLISSIRTYAVDLTHIMFGNVLGVSTGDLIVTVVLAAIVLGFIAVFFREFLVMSFDPVLAATLRMRAERFRVLLLILLALTIVVSLQTVGVGLVAALLVTPSAAAYLLTRRLSSMMIAAGFLGALSSVIGLYLSFYLNVASGAAVVLTATLIFLLAYLFAPARGLLPRWWQARGARIKAA
jgi:ABC-type Mn2+/Zn2+ transport system permease subunit